MTTRRTVSIVTRAGYLVGGLGVVTACAPESGAHGPDLPGVVFDPSGRVVSIPEDLTITAEYGPCAGDCPEYAVTLRADLTARYEGFRCVRDPGPVDTTVDIEPLQSIVERLGAMRYFELSARFDADDFYTSNLPPTALTVTSAGRTASTLQYFLPESGRDEVPTWFLELVDVGPLVADAIDAARWVGDVALDAPDLAVPCGSRE